MKRILILLIILLTITSCSFQDTVEKTKKIERPSIILNDSIYTVNSENEDKITFYAKYLEMYDEKHTALLKELKFKQVDKENNLILEGYCDTADIETDEKNVVLTGNIFLNHVKEQMQFKSNSLKWNTKKKLLETDTDSSLQLSYKDDIKLTGKGFKGDLSTLDFDFLSTINGEINEEKESSTN